MSRHFGGMALVAGAALSGCGGGSESTGARETPAAEASTAAAGAPLADPLLPVHRFANTATGAYFYTADVAEKDAILRERSDMRYEGVGFTGQVVSPGYGAPVHRFANLANGGYFYTASSEERDFVIQTRQDMRYDGASFAAAPAGAGPKGAAVVRLANLSNGAYLYSRQPEEVQAAEATGRWRNEGVAYFEAMPARCWSLTGVANFQSLTFKSLDRVSTAEGRQPKIYSVLQSSSDTADLRAIFTPHPDIVEPPYSIWFGQRNTLLRESGLPLALTDPDYFRTKTLVGLDVVLLFGLEQIRVTQVEEKADRVEVSMEACSDNMGVLDDRGLAHKNIWFAIDKTTKPIVLMPLTFSPLPMFIQGMSGFGRCPAIN